MQGITVKISCDATGYQKPAIETLITVTDIQISQLASEMQTLLKSRAELVEKQAKLNIK